MVTKEELNREFESIAPQLKAYVLRITASVHDTDDIVQDTWVKALTKLESFKGESSLKTWIFAIATNLARDLIRSKKRWPENVTDICREAALSNPDFLQEAVRISQQSPQGDFEIKEHISFCFTCVSKSLPIEQQVCLLLKDVHGFSVPEIAEILNLTEAMVKYYLHTARSKMADIFDRRCSLINKEGVCHQCTELNGIFNPKQDSQVEAMKIKMVQDAKNADKQYLFELRTAIVRELDPFESGAAELQLGHLEHNRRVMEKYLKKTPD